MAAFALNMLYGGQGETSSPVFKEATFANGEAKLSFYNASSLRTVNGLDPVGFAICGENRVFYPAEATIGVDGRVTLKSRFVKTPIAATYAFSAMSVSANLCSEEGFPVAPFRTDKITSSYYHPKDWQYCDALEYFASDGSGTSMGLAENREAYLASTTAELSVSEDGDYGNAVKIAYALRGRETFWFSPVLNQSGVFEQFSRYDTLSFKVKNPQSRAITLECVEVTLSDGRTGKLALSNGSGTSAEISAGGGYQAFAFSLDALYNESGRTDISSSRALIADIRIYFKDYLSGELLIDSFAYGNIADMLEDKNVDEEPTPPVNEQPDDPEPPVGNEDKKKKGCKSVVGILPCVILICGVGLIIRRKTE